jgi:hypothetical protein
MTGTFAEASQVLNVDFLLYKKLHAVNPSAVLTVLLSLRVTIHQLAARPREAL